MRTSALLTLCVYLGGCGTQESKDENAKDAAALKGKWAIVSSEFEGKPATAVYRKGTVIVFEDDKSYITNGFEKSDPTVFKLDANRKPKSIDLGEDKGERKLVKGIYELDGESGWREAERLATSD